MFKIFLGHRIDPWVEKIPWKMQPTPVFLPENFDGQRSRADYSSRGNKELDTTEQLNTFVLFIYLLPFLGVFKNLW